jgi:hypothetical protein
LIIEGRVILELKSVERVAPAHKKQVQTYLKLTGCKLGYLLNFGEEVMRTGITRCVNGLEEQPLRPCASAGENQVPTTGCYVAGIPSRLQGTDHLLYTRQLRCDILYSFTRERGRA